MFKSEVYEPRCASVRFKFRPNIYTSFIKCMRTKMDSVFHVRFHLLPSKTKQYFDHMFRHLTEVCAKFDVTLYVYNILNLDFEIVVNEAAVARWPNVLPVPSPARLTGVTMLIFY